MRFEEFASDIKSSMQQHVVSGLIDDMKIYDLMLEGLSDLSTLPTIRIETVLTVKNNKVKLPDGFKSLYSAIKCEPFAIVTDSDDSPEDILLDIYQYKVREVTNGTWNICKPCDVDITESCVVEKVYLHNGNKHNLVYNNPSMLKLKLTPYVKKTKCDKECVNFSEKNSPYEISINNKYLYTNFSEGNIFLTYNGYDEDDEGFVIIPETNTNSVQKYLKAYVTKELMKQVMLNGDATQVEQTFYTLLSQEASKYLQQASGELKMSRLLPTLGDYTRKIRRQFDVFNYGKLSSNGSNRIEFLVT